MSTRGRSYSTGAADKSSSNADLRELEGSARASLALQRTINLLSRLDNAKEFLPEVLCIVAEAFGARSCGFFEQSMDTIWLRYWWKEGRVFGPEELPNVDPDNLGAIIRMARGFSVPVSHLGVDPFVRKEPSVVEHWRSEGDVELQRFAVAMGWDRELNVPLNVEDNTIGALVIYRSAGEMFDAWEVALGSALGKQLALALQVSQLARREREGAQAASDQAQAAALARQREDAATRELLQEARANAALQETIDAVSSLPTLDELIPAVLGVVARTFAVGDCAFFDALPEEPIRLRFWAHDGRVLRPSELATAMPHHPEVVDRLTAGFSVPDSYFGTSNRERVRPVLVDHVRGTSVPEFDAWALANGFGTELNMPLVANARMAGALVIYRRADATFEPAEIALADRLGKQLALAVAAARLAEDAVRIAGLRADEARDAAVVRERAAAAQRHAQSLERANDAMRHAIQGLAGQREVRVFLEALLRASVQVAGAHSGAFALLIPSGVEHVALQDVHGAVPRARSVAEGTAKLAMTPAIEAMCRNIVADTQSWVIPVDREPNPDSMITFHQRNGTRSIVCVPLLVGSRLLGWLGLGFPTEEPQIASSLELLRLLADQATTAVELARLADAARHVAIGEERQRMAGEIHDSLAQSFTSIVLQSESLIADLEEYSPLRATLEVIEETARLGLAEARSSVLALRPIGDMIGDLQTALAQLAERCNIAGSVTCEFRTSTEPCALGADVRDAVLRVAQEAVNNALRHSNGLRLVIRFDVEDGEALLSVADDGVGMPELVRQRAGGFGIAGMRSRAESLGGTLTVSNPTHEGGTVVRMRVPCHAAQAG